MRVFVFCTDCTTDLSACCMPYPKCINSNIVALVSLYKAQCIRYRHQCYASATVRDYILYIT